MKKYLKAFILMLAGIFSISLTACNKTNNTNNESSTKTFKVMSDSMEWSDEYPKLVEWDNYEIKGFSNGDKLVVSTTYDELKIGDVITYQIYSDSVGKKITNTSRIVDILSDSSTYVVEDDRIAQQYPYRTTYGSSYIYDLETSGKVTFVNSNNIIGKVTKVEYKEA